MVLVKMSSKCYEIWFLVASLYVVIYLIHLSNTHMVNTILSLLSSILIIIVTTSSYKNNQSKKSSWVTTQTLFGFYFKIIFFKIKFFNNFFYFK
jgi:heme/copper-type cytochrome/quinol oxidase subunit 3